jgi:hypothetical protein
MLSKTANNLVALALLVNDHSKHVSLLTGLGRFLFLLCFRIKIAATGC